MSTLLELRTRSRERADAENDTDWVTDSELNQYINDSYKELYAMLLRSSLLRSETNQTITLTGATTYAVPADYLATLNVYRSENQTYVRLRRADLRDRPFGLGLIGGEAYEYRVANGTLELFPTPGTGSYIHSYVPLPNTLALDGDLVDGVLGWDEFIVIDVAIKMKHKEGDDIRGLSFERERIKERIADEAALQEMTETYRIRSRRGRGSFVDPADIWHGFPDNGFY